jgi:hypothetical protein
MKLEEMPMEHAAQTFAAVNLLVIGLSHLIQPRVWLAYFGGLAAQGTPGAFVDGFLSLTFGTIIVAFHNVWHGPALVLTVIGWGQVVKGLSRFVAPQLGIRLMRRVSSGSAWPFQAGGVFAMLLSGYLWWLRFAV